MVKLKLAKFQGPVIPERWHEPAQIVQEIPPTHMPQCCEWDDDGDGNCPIHSAKGVFRIAALNAPPYAEERDADRLEVSP